MAKDKLLREIEALCVEVDELPDGDPRRSELVNRIFDLNVEHQAEG
ncbi:MAG: hypothetical protein ABSH46_22495 [Bryobacteraceae bacterium]|jgi:hypothetical protein